MNVAIISIGRSHLLNLAKQLSENKNYDVIFYTMLPKSRCEKYGYNGKVVTCYIATIISILIEKIPFINPYRRSYLRIRLRILFDRIIAWKLKSCQVLIGLNGAAVKASIKAQKKYNAIAICDQGSSHILQQDHIRQCYSRNIPPSINTEYMLLHYETADCFVVASDYVRRSDVEQGIDIEKIFVNPYGVDLDKFKPALKHKKTEYDVIMVGSWWKHKGCDLLAEACIERMKLRLLHVGAVIDCELPDSTLFTHIDFVPETELPEYYGRAKVFAMPSLDEGFGLVLLQAAACGLPVVGSSRTGLPDMKALLDNDPKYVLIEEPLSVENIVDAIRTALDYADSHDSHYDIGSNSYEQISWRSYGERYCEILKDIISK